jgi:hypothetical protein
MQSFRSPSVNLVTPYCKKWGRRGSANYHPAEMTNVRWLLVEKNALRDFFDELKERCGAAKIEAKL